MVFDAINKQWGDRLLDWRRILGKRISDGGMIDFVLQVKGYHKVYARYFQSNPASGKVMQKLGMKQEGILLKQVEKEVEDIISNGIIK